MSHLTTPAGTAGVLEHLDPNAVVVGANVRDDSIDLGKDFLASLTEHGVLVPLTAVRDADGSVRVLNGQRRCLAAREVGLASIPVYVMAQGADSEAEAAADRIIHQMVTNDQKSDLTDAQRARGIQQMLDAGFSATKIAKKLSVKRDTVNAAKAAASSDQAMDALASGQLSLTEAAALAEFEDDEQAVARLLRVAGSTQFDHTLSYLRRDREDALKAEAAAAPYAEKGYQVLATRPYGGGVYELEDLRRADGEPADESDIKDTALWAVVMVECEVWVDTETGETVDQDDIDEDTWDDPDATAAEGKRHANTVTEGSVWEPEFYCLDHDEAGLRAPEWAERHAARQATDSVAVGADATDEERAAAKAQAEQAQAEAQRRERRKVLALNKLGLAAIEVRRAHVAKYLSRKTPAKGTASFIAQALSLEAGVLTGCSEATPFFLGVKDRAALKETIRNLGEGTDPRAQVIILGMILGALETRADKDAWRSPGPSRSYGGERYGLTAADYLIWLRDHTGYALAPVEEVVVGTKTADELYDQLIEEKE